MTSSASALTLDHPYHIRHRRGFADKIVAGPMAAVWSSLISVAVALGFVAGQIRNMHWFLFPLTLCGCLIGTDMVKWISNQLDLYDVTGLIALLGYHFFFIAPLLMVTWEYRMKYLPDQPQDYRNWLGAMAFINLGGLLLYKYAVKHLVNPPARKALLSFSRWQIAPGRFWVLWGLFLMLSCGAQIWIFVTFGGVRGYIAAYSQWLSGHDMFQGWALLFAVAESLPVLLAMGLAVYWRKRRIEGWAIAASVFVLTCLILLTSGLRGSRSNVIWNLFWVLGIIHFYVRRLPRILGPIALCLLYGFVSIYASYKQHGGQLFDRVAATGDYSSVSGSAEGPATVLVGDFSRCDVQAYLLYKLLSENSFQYAHGASYLGALTMIVPRSIWLDRPPTIAKWTTDAEYGEGAYQASSMQSSRVYGIAGEGMLNFGPAGILIAYIVFGLLAGMLQGVILRLSPRDTRWLISPFFINLLFLLLLNDSDNAVFYLIKYGLMPISLVLLSTTRQNVRRMPYDNSL
jgi:hypothetical protein